MEQNAAKQLARRASPYGLAIVPENDIHDYTDPRNEAAVQHKWQRLCEQHGAAILGIRDVPTTRVRVQLDGVLWELEPLGSTERVVPAEDFHRWRALEVAGVPFFYWLWGEEQPERPNFRPAPATSTPRSAPGVGRVPSRGITWTDWLAPLRDPIVIGVIPTAPHRGLWVLIGKWFH